MLATSLVARRPSGQPLPSPPGRGRRLLTLALCAAACVTGCNDKPGASATTGGPPGAGAPASNGGASNKQGITVVRSATPKISEAAFMQALDKQLDQVFADVRGKTFRSRAQLSTALGRRLQPKAMINATAKAMGVSDVSVLSLFASDPEIGKRVSAHIKKRTKEVADQLQAKHGELPMVVPKDCHDAAAKGLSLKQVAAGKRQATMDDKRDAPLVAQLLIECKKVSKDQPALRCYLDAADEAALAKCGPPK